MLEFVGLGVEFRQIHFPQIYDSTARTHSVILACNEVLLSQESLNLLKLLDLDLSRQTGERSIHLVTWERCRPLRVETSFETRGHIVQVRQRSGYVHSRLRRVELVPHISVTNNFYIAPSSILFITAKRLRYRLENLIMCIRSTALRIERNGNDVGINLSQELPNRRNVPIYPRGLGKQISLIKSQPKMVHGHEAVICPLKLRFPLPYPAFEFLHHRDILLTRYCVRK